MRLPHVEFQHFTELKTITMNTQKGFGVTAAIGIIALITLLGGATYVATQNNANVDGNATTTDEATTSVKTKGWFNINPRFEEDMTAEDGIDANVDASTSVEVNTGSLLEFEGETNADGSVTNY